MLHCHATPERDFADHGGWQVMLCFLGDFRILKAGEPVSIRAGSKIKALLSCLALHHEAPVPREALLDAVWPDAEPTRAGPSLNSLVYSVNRQLAGALGGEALLRHECGSYHLNVEAGIGLDVIDFSALAEVGARRASAGDPVAATIAYQRAVDLYAGDLNVGSDAHSILQREYLRAQFLNMLSQLADFYFGVGDYGASGRFAERSLAADPCREDAHRQLMRCYIRRGERAQALRQYRLCELLLRTEFEAVPEPATVALFNQARLDPASV